jgi:hypothetical protein
VPEAPLNDKELRMLRGMIDEYVQESAVQAWLRRRGSSFVKVILFASACVVMIASVEEIVRSIVGG